MAKPQVKSVRIFESDFLERFSHVHPITPLVIWVPVVAYFIFRTAVSDLSVFEAIVTGLSGLVFWTLTEYLLHRFAFHHKGTTRIEQRIYFIIHGNHHDVPNDPTRLVMPPIVSIVLASLFFIGFKATLGAALAVPFFAGFIIGYLWYDYTHYAVHHFKMNSRIGKYLKRTHMEHHFAAAECKWGVSSPLWDFVFGTFKEEPKAIKREHASD